MAKETQEQMTGSGDVPALMSPLRQSASEASRRRGRGTRWQKNVNPLQTT